MSDFEHEMNKVVRGFIAQISQLARRSAIDTLESAFEGRAARADGARVAVIGATGKPGRPRGGRHAKRGAAELDVLSSRFVAFVKTNPGLRIEQINKELRTTTKDLALPIRKLIAEGMISAKGQKRSTQYFPGRKAK